MPVHIRWHIPGRVILIEATGYLTAEEINASQDDSVQLINSTETEIVHVLFDAVHLTSFTRDVFALSNAVQRLLGHPRFGWFVLYGRDDPVVRFIASIVTQIFRRSFKIFRTQEEANEFMDELLQIDDTGKNS